MATSSLTREFTISTKSQKEKFLELETKASTLGLINLDDISSLHDQMHKSGITLLKKHADK